MGRFLGRLHEHYPQPFRTHSRFVNSWELRAQGWDREGRLWNHRSFYYKAPGLSATGYLYTPDLSSSSIPLCRYAPGMQA